MNLPLGLPENSIAFKIADHSHSPSSMAMAATLARLFEWEPADVPGRNPGDAPQIECQVVLKSGYKTAGLLSVENGLLRMMQPGDYKLANGKTEAIMAEHIFSVLDIETLIMIRRIPTPEVVVPGGNGRRIIVPGQ